MKIGDRIDIVLESDDLPENIVIGTVQLVCFLPDETAHALIADIYKSFREESDNSEFVSYLANKWPTIFAEATSNQIHVLS